MPAGSGSNQTRFPDWSTIIGPGVPAPPFGLRKKSPGVAPERGGVITRTVEAVSVGAER